MVKKIPRVKNFGYFAIVSDKQSSLFILLIFFLSSCAPAVNSIQPQRYANIEPAKLREIRTAEKRDGLEILFLSDNTMRYKLNHDASANLVTINIPYTMLPPALEHPDINHPYVKDFEIKQRLSYLHNKSQGACP